MIGNDVVDLNLALKESNWKRKGFLDKIYTSFEQKLIQEAENQDEMVWLLWSLKESMYKAVQRISYVQGLFPIKIETTSLCENNSTIVFDGQRFYGQSCIENNCIHSVVVKNLNDFNVIINFDAFNYGKDKNGLPYDLESKMPLSVSHHGRFLKIIGLNK